MESAIRPSAKSTATVHERAAAIPWFIYAVALGATSIIVGVIWDISWHRTIGRDTFWTPAHMAIYLGGVLGGISGGWLVLKTTFRGTLEEKNASVRFWGFRGPIGAWLSIWGAIAMLTSAPFDDWWHNAYGLDVKIISPPHTLLAAGIIALVLGAFLLVLSEQNRNEGKLKNVYAGIYGYIGGILVLIVATLTMEYSQPAQMHQTRFYMIAGGAYTILLVATARASILRWPATTAALGYMAISCLMIWILPLFSAEPKLAPIYNPVDHMVPPKFPMLMVIPALAIDFWIRRFGSNRDWRLSVILGVSFMAVFFVVQWFFSNFMLTEYARNWFFAGHEFSYFNRPGDWWYRHWRAESGMTLIRGLGIAALLAVVSARLGLWWGNWMAGVKR